MHPHVSLFFHSRMSAPLAFNPLTGCPYQAPSAINTHSLQHLCRHTIVNCVGLKNIHKVEQLPLPPRLKGQVSSLSLVDFFIDGTSLSPQSQDTGLYPATCILTGDHLNIRVIQPGQTPPESENIFARFEEDNHWILVETQIESLRDVLLKSKETNMPVQETIIWKALSSLVSYIKSNDVQPNAHLSTDCIKISGSKYYIEILDGTQNDMPVDATANATYEAPEVLTNEDPDTRALVWSIGCIAYEALALEPAYYDPTGTNPFAAYQNVMAGVIPPMPTNGSTELQDLISKCLVANKDNRITLDDLQTLLSSHL
ncbi:serine/threonine-protein kinase Nek10-like [Mya arenaria]|uniref:serine/threonine-protein kinase Nek10-like n=1 Tax=Mya arenaria TaxID=6604 RepID=UPI0022E2D189|nr:serine/threonine-protein kinase Nek10-like [Mya arenaria]